MTARFERPTVAEIDLGALLRNYHALKSRSDGAAVMAVVKADAYGHGAVDVARSLSAAGCAHFGVATIAEARELRDAGIRGRIYLMGGFMPEQAAGIIALDVTPFIFDLEAIAPLQAAALAGGRTAFPVHLKIDTGATRLGILPDELDEAIRRLKSSDALMVEGVATLLANAGDPSSPITEAQLARFRRACDRLQAASIRPAFLHVANSAAAILRSDATFNMVRIGLALFGLPPVPAVRDAVELTPVMTFKTRVMQLKRVPAGTGVSYGHTFVTARPSTIGILPVGYADGYRRGLQHGGEVLIRGRRAPVVGAVCMDITMVDLTDVADAAVGDEAILWGGAGDAMISANDVARLVQTISYEMLCTVGRRVPRIYRS